MRPCLVSLAVLCLGTACISGAHAAPGSPSPAQKTSGSASASQESNELTTLRGRHVVRIQLGAQDWSSGSESSGTGLTSESGSGGFVGAVGYDYFAREDLAIGISVGVLEAGTSSSIGVGGITSRSATVVPVLAGATYYPEALAIGPNLRPFIAGSAGPYLGSATNNEVGATVATESISEAVFGLRIASGVDWFVSRHVKLGLDVGYHFVDDFDDRIGSTDDYSGVEVSIELGLLLGRGH